MKIAPSRCTSLPSIGLGSRLSADSVVAMLMAQQVTRGPPPTPRGTKPPAWPGASHGCGLNPWREVWPSGEMGLDRVLGGGLVMGLVILEEEETAEPLPSLSSHQGAVRTEREGDACEPGEASPDTHPPAP